jgi:hypothetical protein
LNEISIHLRIRTVMIANRLLNRHLPWLLLGIAVPLMAALLVVIDGEHVGFFFLPDYPFPTLCTARSLLGVDCPGCSLTRSVIHLVHGRIVQSLAMHHLGWFIFLLIVLQAPLRIWCLFRGELNLLNLRATQTLLWIMLGLTLCLDWIWKLISASSQMT